MKTSWMIPPVALLALPLLAWSVEKEQHVTLDQVPVKVKATIEKESAGGKVEEVEKETEHGRTYYEAEIVKNGKESYVHVAEDGRVLKRETGSAERKSETPKK